MNREIKYQAWHKKEKRMIAPVIQLHLDHEPFIGWYETMHDALEGNLTTAFLDEVELREYTGLKDKNGTEIYEGDIYESEDGRDKGVIVFQNCSFEVKWIPPVTFGLRSHLYYNRNGKVIGNTYENPELLKGEETS